MYTACFLQLQMQLHSVRYPLFPFHTLCCSWNWVLLATLWLQLPFTITNSSFPDPCNAHSLIYLPSLIIKLAVQPDAFLRILMLEHLISMYSTALMDFKINLACKYTLEGSRIILGSIILLGRLEMNANYDAIAQLSTTSMLLFQWLCHTPPPPQELLQLLHPQEIL